MGFVDVGDLERIMPRPLEADERPRAEALLEQAVEKIRTAFLRAGRDFDAELVRVPWLPSTAKSVVLEMVGGAVLTGSNVGVRSVSSTTGPVADSITWATVDGAGFGGVLLTDAQRMELGLPVGGVPRGRFPTPKAWPEVRTCRNRW